MLRTTQLLPNPPPQVSVQVYTESLCPGCKEFTLEDLVPTFHKLGPSIVDLSLVPFGNALINEEEKAVECQHGLAECDANTWEQCALEYNKDPRTWMVFFGCLDSKLPMGYSDDPLDESTFETCAALSGMDFEAIQNCHNDPDIVWSLQEKYAALTPEDHEYVPWIVVDGKAFDLENESQSFLEVVCKAYISKGGTHPACDEDALALN